MSAQEHSSAQQTLYRMAMVHAAKRVRVVYMSKGHVGKPFLSFLPTACGLVVSCGPRPPASRYVVRLAPEITVDVNSFRI